MSIPEHSTSSRGWVSPEWIKQQREQGWPDMHPEDYCHRCGKPNRLWAAHPQQVWLDGTGEWAKETGREGICCIDCFTTMYEQNTGTRPIWMLTIFDPNTSNQAGAAAVSAAEQITPPGARVQFAESKRWWKVRAVSEDGRFAILTSPFNLRKTLFYTIIDNQRGVRGPDDRIFSSGYETDEQIADRMRELEAGEIKVTQRSSRYIELDIVMVDRTALKMRKL